MIDLPIYNEKNACKILNKALKGATILAVRNATQPEHIFVLEVQYPNGEVQALEIGATDLGWWINQPFSGKHDFYTITYKDGSTYKSCKYCLLAESEIKSSICKGEPTYDE